MAFCVVLITAPSGGRASALARQLVDLKLAACVNRVPGVESVFWWHQKIETSTEELLLVKTDKLKVKAIVKAAKEAGIGDTPEVISLRIKEGNRDYLRWIADSLGTPRAKQRVPKGSPKKPRSSTGPRVQGGGLA